MIRFSPSKAVTAAFLAGSLFGGIATVAGATIRGSSVFSDVPVDSYYDDAVGEMYSDGVIKGNPDGSYRPGDPVSRAEVAVMFQRFKDSLDGTTVRSSSSRSRSSSSDSVSSSSSSSSASATPTTNPQGIFRFTTSTYTVAENAATGFVNITIVRTGGNQGSVAVDYAVTAGTATAGSDFEVVSGTLSFAAKETSKTFTVKILDDSASEGTETATIKLSGATNGAIIASPDTATISITDNESSSTSSVGTSSTSSNANGTLSLAASTYGVLENVGSFTVTVNRTGGSTGTVGVTYSTANGTATSGTDYSSANGTLSFAAGETSKTFTITVNDDSNVDGAKAFTITLTSPTGGASLGTATATATIFDNESTTEFGSGALKLPKASYDVAEGDKKIELTVQRVGGTKGTVTVNYSTTNGSAIAGDDFVSTSGTLTFAPGESSKIVTIAITDDSNSESGDYFFFDLSSPVNATLSSPSSTTVNLFD